MTNAIFESRKENSIERMRCEASACLTYTQSTNSSLLKNSPLSSRRRSVFLFFVTPRARSLWALSACAHTRRRQRREDQFEHQRVVPLLLMRLLVFQPAWLDFTMTHRDTDELHILKHIEMKSNVLNVTKMLECNMSLVIIQFAACYSIIKHYHHLVKLFRWLRGDEAIIFARKRQVEMWEQHSMHVLKLDSEKTLLGGDE